MDGERCPENDEADMRKVQLNPSQIKTQQERKRVFKDLQRPEAKTEQLGEAWALAVAVVAFRWALGVSRQFQSRTKAGFTQCLGWS